MEEETMRMGEIASALEGARHEKKSRDWQCSERGDVNEPPNLETSSRKARLTFWRRARVLVPLASADAASLLRKSTKKEAEAMALANEWKRRYEKEKAKVEALQREPGTSESSESLPAIFSKSSSINKLNQIYVDDCGGSEVGAAAAAAISLAAAHAFSMASDGRKSHAILRRTISQPGKVGFRLICNVQDKDDTCAGYEKYIWSNELRLMWLETPRQILMVMKPQREVRVRATAIIQDLLDHGLVVLLEPSVAQAFESLSNSHMIRTWEEDSLPQQEIDNIDFVVTLGGDGTVLWATKLFGNGPVPPVISFAMGSLGFMTPFPLDEYKNVIDGCISAGFKLNLRHRLHCSVLKAGKGECCDAKGHSVLNEVVIDRGGSPFLTQLECYCDENFATMVEGDGLIISSTTGSTAYNLAAGGPIVQPEVPAMIFTPVCPHSLSFRPLVFPSTVTLKITVPDTARANCNIYYDGSDKQVLERGDSVLISMSMFPVPHVAYNTPTTDWFHGVRQNLHWNLRKPQLQISE